MSVRAKFRVTSRKMMDWHPTAIEVELTAVVDNDGKGNESWAEMTPSGLLTMLITNTFASDQLVLGKEFFLDFTPVENAVTVK